MLVRFSIFMIWSLTASISNASPAPVTVITLSEQIFTETIEALGTLKSNEAITLTATVTDTISAVYFEDGQRVHKGAVIVEMTSNEEHAQLEEARFVLEEAERQYQRVQSLAKTNLATASLLDQRRQTFQAAQSQLLAMQSRMADRLIIAPFSGVLGMRDISVGTLVRPGDRITTLDDDSSMKLDMTIPAVFLDGINIGLKIEAQSREWPDKIFHGVITAIDSRIDPNTRAVLVRARLKNPDTELKTGMLMTVDLKKSGVQALLVPEEALIQEGFQTYIYRVPNKEPLSVDKVQIEIGARHAGKVVVTQGVAANDKIVIDGVMRLKQNALIRIVEPLNNSDAPKPANPVN